jgi:hypothetical protein
MTVYLSILKLSFPHYSDNVMVIMVIKLTGRWFTRIVGDRIYSGILGLPVVFTLTASWRKGAPNNT